MIIWKTVHGGKLMKIRSERVYTGKGFEPAVIVMENGTITGILPYGSADEDYGDRRIVPGFIDVHCHGAYGFDTDTADPAGLRNWTKKIVSDGVTSLLATTVTESTDVLMKAVRNVADVVREGYEGARILGIHLEGPYLNVERKGAQPEEAIVKGTPERFEALQKEADGLIRIVTLAPECDENHALIHYCADHGIAASLGHSSATFEEAVSAFRDGAKSITHTFNAMTPLHHRKPGLAGAALRFHDQYSEIICDCHHVSPDVLNIFFTCKDDDKAVMISDSLMCKGLPAGTKFIFGGQPCHMAEDGLAYLDGDGSIAGSTMHTNDGLKNLVTRAGVPFNKALKACTCNPAHLIGYGDRKGMIRYGYDADLCVLNDDYSVEATFVGGRKVFSL
jgi:N-acetylglucosamine-6-phosphate deacetylase